MSNSIDLSGLFTASSTVDSGYGAMGSIYANLSQSAMNKSGVALKVAKKYVAVQSGADQDSKSEAKKSEDRKLTMAKSAADKAGDSLKNLVNGSLFDKTTVKDAEGNETTDYDWDSITSEVKSFVGKYNVLISAGSEPDTLSVLRQTKHMTGLLQHNAKLLSSIGITIGEGNKLTVDEEKLKSSGVSPLKALFQGSGSMGSQIQSYASAIGRSASRAMNAGKTYTSSGGYSSAATSATGTMLDTLVGDEK